MDNVEPYTACPLEWFENGVELPSTLCGTSWDSVGWSRIVCISPCLAAWVAYVLRGVQLYLTEGGWLKGISDDCAADNRQYRHHFFNPRMTPLAVMVESIKGPQHDDGHYGVCSEGDTARFTGISSLSGYTSSGCAAQRSENRFRP